MEMQFTIGSILVNVIAPDSDTIVTTCTGEMFEGQARLKLYQLLCNMQVATAWM